jgi:hypothetical protein
MRGSEDRTRVWLVGGVGTDRLSKPPYIDMSDLREEGSRTFWAHVSQGGHCSYSTSPLASDDSEGESE